MESELERIERRRHRVLNDPSPPDSRKGWRRWLRRPRRFRRDPSRLELNAQRSDCVLMEQIGSQRMLIYSLDRQRAVIRKLRPLNRWEKLARLRDAIIQRLRRRPMRQQAIHRRRMTFWNGVIGASRTTAGSW
ncbi:MAG: hypothetical protein ACI8UO_005449 [Verrucomicrobiales bacterium]|jgi:hypothetical protein